MYDDVKKNLRTNYTMIEKLLREHKIDINTVKVQHDESDICLYSKGFANMGAKKCNELMKYLNYNWKVEKKLPGNFFLVTFASEEGKCFVDFDPKRVESQDSVISKVSTVNEIQAPTALPLSPSHVRVK